MLRKLLAAVAVCVAVGPVAAQPDPKKPDLKVLITKVYDLRAILAKKVKTDGAYAPVQFADTNAVIKVILDALPTLRELKPGSDGPQLVERENGTLEVRATADTHAELKDLIAAMERLADVAVDVKAEVYELGPAAFEKLTRSLPKVGRGRPGAAILFAIGEEAEKEDVAKETEKALAGVNTILKAARKVQESTGRYANGGASTFAARQSVVTFRQIQGDRVVAKQVAESPEFVKEGFTLSGVPVVSADRRFVRLSLTEKSVLLTGMRKWELGEIKDQRIVAQSPELEDAGASSSAVVADGGTAIFRLAYAPKDKVWVVVLTPTIFIQAEEDERKKEKKK